ALHLHRTLGLNLAFPVLPFHGRRNPGARFASMPSADVLETIHGLAQCVWDVRQLLAHLRSRSDQPVGLLGLSLGGLVSAMVASLDRPDAALLLVPAVDMPTLMAEGAALSDDVTDDERDLMKRSEPLFAPVSPLRLTPTVPREARFIVAGTLDRFARPRTQAMALWEHWERPELRWYHGGHVSLFWARNVQAAIDDKLRAVRLA
ncbi:MAG TPA: alpha/beta hydrolase, partial [Acidimicrobiales bacterium]|nr:alpha/beta hydrolase [Acidimicrobiales bacterium]